MILVVVDGHHLQDQEGSLDHGLKAVMERKQLVTG